MRSVDPPIGSLVHLRTKRGSLIFNTPIILLGLDVDDFCITVFSSDSSNARMSCFSCLWFPDEDVLEVLSDLRED